MFDHLTPGPDTYPGSIPSVFSFTFTNFHLLNAGVRIECLHGDLNQTQPAMSTAESKQFTNKVWTAAGIFAFVVVMLLIRAAEYDAF